MRRELLAAAPLLSARFPPRFQPSEQFLIERLIGLGLRRDDRLLFGREGLLRLLAEVQVLLARGLRAAFAASAPQHIDQALLGRFEFRHALPQCVAIAKEYLSGVYQGLVVMTRCRQLSGHLTDGCR